MNKTVVSLIIFKGRNTKVFFFQNPKRGGGKKDTMDIYCEKIGAGLIFFHYQKFLPEQHNLISHAVIRFHRKNR